MAFEQTLRSVGLPAAADLTSGGTSRHCRSLMGTDGRAAPPQPGDELVIALIGGTTRHSQETYLDKTLDAGPCRACDRARAADRRFPRHPGLRRQT